MVCKRLLKYLRNTGCELKYYGFALSQVSQIEQEQVRKAKVSTEFLEYIWSLEPRPESLQFQCRRVIRQQMSIAADGKSILDGIDDLPLPATLHDYLKLKDAK